MLKSFVLGFAISSFAVLGAAQAAIVTVSYSGTLSEGVDTSGFFGTGSTDLSNNAVLLTYVFDTTKGMLQSSANEHYAIGGTSYGVASPALSDTISINNYSVSLDGSESGTIDASNDLGVSHQYHAAFSATGDSAYSSVDAALGNLPNSITTAFSYTVNPLTDTAFARFDLADGSYGVFVPKSIAESVSAVPLPSSLPLFGIGLAGLGAAAALRKRDRLNASR